MVSSVLAHDSIHSVPGITLPPGNAKTNIFFFLFIACVRLVQRGEEEIVATRCKLNSWAPVENGHGCGVNGGCKFDARKVRGEPSHWSSFVVLIGHGEQAPLMYTAEAVENFCNQKAAPGSASSFRPGQLDRCRKTSPATCICVVLHACVICTSSDNLRCPSPHSKKSSPLSLEGILSAAPRQPEARGRETNP